MDQERLDHLIEKYANGTATEEELDELFDWYKSAAITTVEWPADDPGEKEQLRLRMLNRLHGQINANGGPSRLYFMRGWRVAASLIVIISALWIARKTLGPTGGPDFDTTHSNPSGRIQAIRLPDSSTVWLNAATTIRYPSDFSKHREIVLEGEAYFDVASDPRHPFIVHAGSLTTTVLGTAFDVKSFAGDGQASISVVRGKVQVADSIKVLDVLTPARQLLLDKRSGLAQTMAVDTNQVIGWQQGRLQFAGQTLEDIAASLGRWYDVRFVFAGNNDIIRHCRYYLNFENTIALPDLLSVLGESTGLHFQKDDTRGSVTISGNACQ